MAAIILTSLLSYFLFEENRQILGLRLRLGSLCCPEDQQFHWACEKEYKSLLKYYLHSSDTIVTKAKNLDGLTGFQYSYRNNKYVAMEMMITHPFFLDEKSVEIGKFNSKLYHYMMLNCIVFLCLVT